MEGSFLSTNRRTFLIDLFIIRWLVQRIFILQSRSIHGMTEEGADARPHRSMGALTFQEKKFLLAVERGDVASSRREV